MRKTAVNVTLERDLVEYLKGLAKEYGISFSSLVQILIKQGAASLINRLKEGGDING